MAWCGVVRCGVAWCGVEWCGVEWCGVAWCGVVWSGVEQKVVWSGGKGDEWCGTEEGVKWIDGGEEGKVVEWKGDVVWCERGGMRWTMSGIARDGS